jgi:hypothetical protein
MKDVADVMETPVKQGTVFRCTKPGCGGEVQVTHVPDLPVQQPYTCVCGGVMEQVSTDVPLAGG